jgi:hypothetical protein
MSKYRKQRRANSFMTHPGQRAAASNLSFGPHIITPRTLEPRVSAVQNLSQRVLTTATSMIAARPINSINCEGRALALGQLVKKEKDRGLLA